MSTSIQITSHVSNKDRKISRLEWALKAAAGATALAFLTSCSPDLSQNAASSVSESSAAATNGAECNTFSAGTPLNGKLTTYYVNNTLQTDTMRLRLTGVDSRFSTLSTTYIQFFRWTADANGTTTLDSTPLSFTISKGTTNTSTISTPITSLSYAMLTQIRANAAVSGSNAQDFFNNTVFILGGLDSSWSAVKAVLYDSTATIAQADMLLPIFAANPQTYAQHYPPVLSNLHPLITLRGSQLSDADWLARTKLNCF